MSKAEFGMVGLGTMGRNFLLNIAERGFSAAGHDIDPAKCRLLEKAAAGTRLAAFDSLAGFMTALEVPRKIMLLVPAGRVVDSVIGDLLPHLAEGDLLVDGGNSHFLDTERRLADLGGRGIGFLGVGVSGGEEGARHGPSIMAGGDPRFYAMVRSIFEAASAKVNGEPCAALVGRGSAGHFVKMTHNGIEYAMMQLIAETYDLLKRGCGLDSDKIGDLFANWNEGKLNSFLVEITSFILKKKDADTGRPLVDMILDTAGQKGTGRWTSQAAMDLGVPIPSIDSAVTMRQISARKQLRESLARQLAPSQINNYELVINNLKDALYAGFLLAYAQGLSLLHAASTETKYELDIAEIAKIWRGGCIIRAAMLDDIREAFEAEPELSNLIGSSRFQEILDAGYDALRTVNTVTLSASIPAMAFAATLNYLTSFRTERLPANLIQAQRDHFGAHTYQRIDREGTFHTDDWEM
ncbi:MAG: NADP-dependent phosphogluconate dehydrogenase [Chloracidobacterium sp.]|nr:NADP-dependent phosphogluconate dehydrogenase [Chloracidobacterium sp.]